MNQLLESGLDEDRELWGRLDAPDFQRRTILSPISFNMRFYYDRMTPQNLCFGMVWKRAAIEIEAGLINGHVTGAGCGKGFLFTTFSPNAHLVVLQPIEITINHKINKNGRLFCVIT